MTPEEITKLIDDKIAEAAKFATPKLGDTPTDDLQLTPKKYVDALFAAVKVPYPGRVTSNAAGTPFPTGWSVTRASAGRYQITHNLGSTNYSVNATMNGGTGYIQILSIGTNSFNVNTRNTSAADTDFDFEFVLVTS